MLFLVFLYEDFPDVFLEIPESLRVKDGLDYCFVFVLHPDAGFRGNRFQAGLYRRYNVVDWCGSETTPVGNTLFIDFRF